MPKLGQTSFRRILLSRIVLLCVPILLMGVYVTYRKATSSLQDTARQNLIESAVRTGDSITESIEALKTNLVTASQTVVLQSGLPEASQKFLQQLAPQLPTEVECIQLTNLQTGKIAASNCGLQSISAINANLWPQKQKQLLLQRKQIVTTLLPGKQQAAIAQLSQSPRNSQLKLLLSAPVYDSRGQLRYALSVFSALLKQEQAERGSLAGSPVVIDQDGKILAHPIASRVGRNIAEEEDAERLQATVKNAIAGKQYFQHLSSFEQKDVELLAGYTAIPSPLTNQLDRKWIILAVQSRENALFEIREIWLLLFILTLSLIVASLLATLYIARELARPVEKLRDYAKDKQHLRSTDRVPNNFKIREFHQLALALDSMVERLRAGAEQLETAWKEAQTANQLKNEFLATTSHELRTPLNGIIGCIQLVRDGYCDDREEELELLLRANEAAIHLLGIINDVLDIAKIEAGKLSVVMEPFDLRKVLSEVIDLQAVSIHQKNLQFNTPDLQAPLAVCANPAKLKQVLLNVVGNATKFTDFGSITITTRVEEEQGNSTDVEQFKIPSRIVVTVQDTGIGIDPDQQQKLFRPFAMVDGSTTRKFGGTGLGLAISRNLMELMGGSITLVSEGEGKGTTVEIALPTIEPSLLPSGESTQLNGKSASV